MKRLSLIPVCMLMLLVFVPSFTSVSGYTPPAEYKGTSPPIGHWQRWSLPIGDGYVDAGNVIQWHWNASGSLTFRVVYTSAYDLKAVQISGRGMDDGMVVNVTGWYELDWYNFGPAGVTVNYLVDVFTPALGTSEISEGAYLDSHDVVVRGTTDAFATGVLVGPDAMHLHKASTNGTFWETNLALSEGKNTIVLVSYYWLRPLGAANLTLTRTINVTVDTVRPLVIIASPTDGASIRGREVRVFWNCSDSVGLEKVDIRVDNGPWITVSWGDMLGLGYSPVGLSSGQHTILVRGTDRAGNQATAFTTVRTNSNDWSLGGPMYGLPTIGIILAAIVLSLVTYFAYAKPRPEAQPPPVPVEPPAAPKDPGQP